nr:endolytic transglycosylase MltG [Tomitella biformata]
MYVPGAEPEKSSRLSRRDRGRVRRAELRRRRRRGVLVLVFLVVLLAGIGVVSYKYLVGSTDADFAGPGTADVVVQVVSGQTTTDIASTMLDEGVVASTGAFLSAAKGNAAIDSIHPGYYKMRTEISGADAVAKLTEANARVGALVIPEGRQLADITTVDGHVTPGIIRLISEASCVDRDERLTCVEPGELQDALIGTGPEQFGVADWAVDRVKAVPDPLRRYEGLIQAGSWDLDPDWTAGEMLTHLFTQSTASFNAMGLAETKDTTGLSPYDTLIAASLIEREAQPQDFPKVARVIINRLAVDQQLQFDSTVNYALVSQEVATTDEDRARVTPWNTYAMHGLPATPISTPGEGAIQAAEHPADGDWLYFVTVDKNGTTVFTSKFEDHEASIVTARANGVLDSGR